MTTNHEMAQIGYASESECNFGFSFCKNDNLHIQYSGYSMALRYCLKIGKPDEAIFKQLLKHSSSILKTYKESEHFWKQYDTIDKVSML
jgi:hypothetical protein